MRLKKCNNCGRARAYMINAETIMQNNSENYQANSKYKMLCGSCFIRTVLEIDLKNITRKQGKIDYNYFMNLAEQ